MSRLLTGQKNNVEYKLTQQRDRIKVRQNLVALKKALSDLSYLKANGEISDKTFNLLFRYACTSFVENQVEQLIQEALEEKLEQFWLEKVPLLGKYLSKIDEDSYNLDISKLLRSR
ncbi:hypothetical protein PCC8801_2104 [Rippkaea orientalis PCC 8801]|uniref:Uncharacterized protein n=1 Tax=Rippkaea orientalis (strain PCC 8801 / RF-1) TaxID=41431 RepID=B7JZY9_RIPO1|nr:hypothetical protein [Rippkaea orientalis]ACK66136.1 hypothetical protein PCC8801_2104 [Rippkaea orientalis PCC 8801]